jgi:hypothetical protein
MKVMIPLVLSPSYSNLTWSPTATGLVARIPLILNFPLIPQLTISPSVFFTVYQRPVDFITVPSPKANVYNSKVSKKQLLRVITLVAVPNAADHKKTAPRGRRYPKTKSCVQEEI